MSHSHEHVHDESYDPSYYTDQLCTIGVCGLLGGVAVMLYYQGMIRFILADYLHIYVLWSGFGLLGLTAIRAGFLWASVGRAGEAHHHDHCNDDPDVCDHDHDHDHDHEHEHMEEPAALALDHHHGHDHEHEHPQEDETASIAPDHGHDYGHSHAWRPWRYMVLCLPIFLYFLNLPNQGFSSVAAVDVEDSGRTVESKAGDVMKLEFKELERWAYNEVQRDFYEGRKGRLKGQFAPGKNDKTFGLVRFKITCCAADAIPLNVVIISPDSVTHVKNLQWVDVTGKIEFRKKRDKDEYVPVLQLQSRDDVQPTEPDYNPYIQ
jgi:uncharacterized membrane protein YcgQ (UPF0703/DUF1980 family)